MGFGVFRVPSRVGGSRLNHSGRLQDCCSWPTRSWQSKGLRRRASRVRSPPGPAGSSLEARPRSPTGLRPYPALLVNESEPHCCPSLRVTVIKVRGRVRCEALPAHLPDLPGCTRAVARGPGSGRARVAAKPGPVRLSGFQSFGPARRRRVETTAVGGKL